MIVYVWIGWFLVRGILGKNKKHDGMSLLLALLLDNILGLIIN